MNRGAIEQFAAPDEIYLRRSTAFALGFVGHSTRISGSARQVSGATMAIDTPLGLLRARGSYRAGTSVLVAVRPERIRVGARATGGSDNVVSATLKEIVFQGSRVHLHFAGAQEQALLVEASQLPGDLGVGSTATLSWPVEDTLVFALEGAP